MTPPFSSMANPTPKRKLGVNFRVEIDFWSHFTLPETQENHRFDGAELEDGVERRQQVPGRKIEEIKPVEGQRHWHIVDDCDVDVAGVGAPVTVVVVAAGLQENDDERHDWLHQAELQRGLFAEPQKADGVSLPCEAASSVEARRPDRLATDLRHDVSFAAQVLVAQRQEVVDYKSCKSNKNQSNSNIPGSTHLHNSL